jgi:hypothetical protein
MKCIETRRDMFAFLDGEVSVERNLEVLQHVNLCPPCGRRFEAEKRFEEGLGRTLAAEALPPGLRARLGAALERESADAPAAPRPARRGFRFPGGRWGFLAAAASLLVAAVLAADRLCLGPFRCPLLVAATEAATGLEQGRGSKTPAPAVVAPDLAGAGLRKVACSDRVPTPTLGIDWTVAEYQCADGRVCLVSTEVGDHDPKAGHRVLDAGGRAWWDATVGDLRVHAWKEGGTLRALVTRCPKVEMDRLGAAIRRP